MVRRFRAGVSQVSRAEEVSPTTSTNIQERRIDPAIQSKIISSESEIKRLEAEADRLGTGRSNRTQFNKVVNRIQDLRSDLITLRDAQQSGETSGSVQRRLASARLQTQRQIAQTKTRKQPQRKTKGLKPIFSNGELVGFEDPVTRMSVGVEQAVGVIGKERLEKEGFKVTTTQVKTKIQERKVTVENIFTGERQAISRKDLSIRGVAPTERIVGGKLFEDAIIRGEAKRGRDEVFLKKDEAKALGVFSKEDRKIKLSEKDLTLSQRALFKAEDITGTKDSGTISIGAEKVRIDKLTPFDVFNIAEGKVARRTTIPISEKVKDITGKSLSKLIGDTARMNVIPLPDVSDLNRFSKKINIPSLSSARGIIAETTVKDVVQKPLKNVALIGVGGIVGSGRTIIAGSGRTIIAGSRLGKIKTLAKVGRFTELSLFGGAVALGGVDVALQPTTKGKIETGIITAKDFTLFGAGAGLGSKPFRIKELRIPLRELKQPFALEFAEPKVSGGKVVRSSRVTIFSEIRQPTDVIKTTPFREFFDIKPIKSKTLGSRFDIKVGTAIDQKPFILTGMRGATGKQISFTGIGGKAQDFKLNLEGSISSTKFGELETRVKLPQLDTSFGKFTQPKLSISETIRTTKLDTRVSGGDKIEQLLAKRLFSQTDVKVGDKLIRSSILTTDIGKTIRQPTLVENIIKLPQLDTSLGKFSQQPFTIFGRTQTQKINLNFQTGTKLKRFQTLATFKDVFKTDTFRVAESTVLFKETTKPFARAFGKTPSLRAIVIEKLTFPTDSSGVNILTPSGTKSKTPLSLTFAKQPPAVVRIAPPKTKPFKITTKNIGGNIGASELKLLGGGGSLTRLDTKQQQKLSITQQFKFLQDFKLDQQFKQVHKLDTSQKGLQTQKIQQQQKTLQQQKILQIQKPVQAQKILQTQKTLQTQKIVGAFKTPSPITRVQQPTIKVPPTNKILIPFLNIKRKPRKRRGLDLFGLKVKTKKGAKLIGSGLNLQQAIGRGQKFQQFKIIPLQLGGARGIRTPKGFKQQKGLVFTR